MLPTLPGPLGQSLKQMLLPLAWLSARALWPGSSPFIRIPPGPFSKPAVALATGSGRGSSGSATGAGEACGAPVSPLSMSSTTFSIGAWASASGRRARRATAIADIMNLETIRSAGDRRLSHLRRASRLYAPSALYHAHFLLWQVCEWTLSTRAPTYALGTTHIMHTYSSASPNSFYV